MGKRSNFPRRKNDDYPTPYEAVVPLLPFLSPWTKFYEPCAGEGLLCNHLMKHDHVMWGYSDVEFDATTFDYSAYPGFDCFITNPPWTRELLHPIILNLCKQAPTWLLFDADWMHTKQAAPYLRHCLRIVSVGRVKWIPDSPYYGKDNACWYLFVFNEDDPRDTTFVGKDPLPN